MRLIRSPPAVPDRSTCPDRTAACSLRIALLTFLDANNFFALRCTFVVSWERKMSVAVQYVVRPNPGTDPAKITELAKEGAVLWRKHGGKVTYWTVAVGEVGNRVLSITFENFAAYGAAVDKMGEDKEVRAWQAKRMKAGYTTWVRSNMATEIEI